MEFDINLILVPVTLVFLVVWLADKFWLKQHKHVISQNRQADLAKGHLERAKKELEQTLMRYGRSESADEFVVHEHTPQALKDANTIYQEAKRSYVHATGGIEPVTEPKIVKWAYEYLPILAVIVLLRSFVAEPFNIPSSSMVPTLYTGDYILVNKAAYGLRLPITHTKIFATGEPAHGDVAVFRYPENPKRYYIKRMIGLPGDTVSFDDGVISINGVQVDTQSAAYQMPTTLNDSLMPQVINGRKLSHDERIQLSREEEKYAHYYQEHLGDHSYVVRYLGDLNTALHAPFLQDQSPQLVSSAGKRWQITVPAGQYFVMGDNRDRSEDGRFWGFVPESHLAGRATYIWMHKEPGLHMPSFGRAGRID